MRHVFVSVYAGIQALTDFLFFILILRLFNLTGLDKASLKLFGEHTVDIGKELNRFGFPESFKIENCCEW